MKGVHGPCGFTLGCFEENFLAWLGFFGMFLFKVFDHQNFEVLRKMRVMGFSMADSPAGSANHKDTPI